MAQNIARHMIKRCLLILSLALLCAGCDPKFWKMQMWMWSENHKSLDFYGKIVDQNNRPVEGVKVRAGVGTIESVTKSGGKDYYTVSDADGRFSFTGIKGAGCGYWLTKDGYEFNRRLPCSSRPKEYVPDPDRPVVFPIWKLYGRIPLVHRSFDSRVPYDGRSAIFDIYAGRKASDGDLQITLTRNPVQITRGREHFDWSVQIKVIGGGLIECSDVYPYEAPVSGYLPEFTFGVLKDSEKWTQRLERTFYVRTRGGNFGRIYIDLTTDSEKPEGTGIGVETFMSPSGSRNLESKD